MTVLLGAPTPVAAPFQDPFPGLDMTWTGWDGSVWRLSDDTSGVRLKRGIRGLTMPPVQRYTSESPSVAGSRYRGSRAQERPVFWPLGVYGNATSQAWLDYDRAFWRTMHPERPGTWTVTQPGGEARRLQCRFVDDGDFAVVVDPSIMGWAVYPVTLVAEQPFWQGDPIVRSWKEQAPASFFGTGAPTFTISSGSTLGNATMPNPGDEDAWATWTLDGPFTSGSVGVNGRVVEVPFGLASGKSLTIDTSPTGQTAIDSDGVERTGDLGAVDFAPIPPGERATLSLALAGTGVVSASLTPLHHRAW